MIENQQDDSAESNRPQGDEIDDPLVSLSGSLSPNINTVNFDIQGGDAVVGTKIVKGDEIHVGTYVDTYIVNEIKNDVQEHPANSIWSIPLQSSAFVNRVEEIKVICSELQSGLAIAVTGRKGIGKTAFVCEVARRLSKSEDPTQAFPDGGIYFNLYRYENIDIVLKQIVTLFDPQPEVDLDSAIRRCLGKKQFLIVIDGMEYVEKDWYIDEINSLIEIGGRCAVLIAHRNPIPGIDNFPLNEFPHNQVPTLLEELVSQTPTDKFVSDAEFINEICAVVGTLPASIKFVGQLLKLSRIDKHKRIRLLRRLKHQNQEENFLTEIIRSSIGSLAPLERRVLALACYWDFVPFHETAVVVGLGKPETEIREVLGKLLEYNFINRTKEGYEVVDYQVYQYVHVNFKSLIGSDVTQRLADYYSNEKHEESIQFHYFIRHVMSVIEHCINEKQWKHVKKLCESTYSYTDFSWYTSSQRRLIEAALTSIQALSKSNLSKLEKQENQTEESKWNYRFGNYYDNCGDYKKAQDKYRSALKRCYDPILRRKIQNALCESYLNDDQPNKVVDTLQNIQTVGENGKEMRLDDQGLTLLGRAYLNIGKNQEATKCFNDAKDCQINMKNEQTIHSVAQTIAYLGDAYLSSDERQEALEQYDSAIEAASLARNFRLSANLSIKVGYIHIELGSLDRVREYWQKAYDLVRDSFPDRLLEKLLSHGLSILGSLSDKTTKSGASSCEVEDLINEELTGRSVNAHRRALGRARRNGDDYRQMLSLIGLGQWSFQQWQMKGVEYKTEDISIYFQRAAIIAKQLKNKDFQGFIAINLGDVEYRSGNLRSAIYYYEKSLFLARQMNDPKNIAISLSKVSVPYSDIGQKEAAIASCKAALEIFHNNNDLRNKGKALHNMGIISCNFEQYQEAIRYSDEAIKISTELDDQLGQAEIFINLAHASCFLNNFPDAREFLGKANAIVEKLAHRWLKIRVLITYGIVSVEQNYTDEALHYCRESIKLAQYNQFRLEEGIARMIKGDAYEIRGCLRRAPESWEIAQGILEGCGSRYATELQEYLNSLPQDEDGKHYLQL